MPPSVQASAALRPSITLLQMLKQDVTSHSTLVTEPELSASFWEQALLNPARTSFSQPGKGFRSSLVNLGWRIAGGEQPALPELAIILEALHGGSLIVDDIEDNSSLRRGRPALHLTHGLPLALNTGNWLYFWAVSLIQRLGLSPGIELELFHTLSTTLLNCHSGQALDLSVCATTLKQADFPSVVTVISGLKTGRLMALAASMGAMAAGGSATLISSLAMFGQQLGVALQMLDDLSNLGEQVEPAKRYEDLRNNRPSWVWAWVSEQVGAEHFARLQEQCRDVVSGADPAALAEELLRHVSAAGEECINQSLDLAYQKLLDIPTHQALKYELIREFARIKVGCGIFNG